MLGDVRARSLRNFERDGALPMNKPQRGNKVRANTTRRRYTRGKGRKINYKEFQTGDSDGVITHHFIAEVEIEETEGGEDGSENSGNATR